MSPNELLTRDGMPELAEMVADRLHEMMKEDQKKAEKLPEWVTGKWLLDRHFCGIGSPSTLSRRIGEVKQYFPDEWPEIVIKPEHEYTQYNPTKLRGALNRIKKQKADDKNMDPRYKLKIEV